MPRPSQIDDQRRRLTPIVAGAFAKLGYRRTTTAELARRCGVRENILYRLWEDKRTMFVASIEYVYALSAEVWGRLLAEADDGRHPAQRLLEYEAAHHGESGLQRLIFAGLSESDDPVIRDALAAMYRRFHRFISGQVADYRGAKGSERGPDAATTAWAVIGLGTLSNIAQELNLLPPVRRKRFIAETGKLLIEGRPTG
ncbi:MAG: TetR/AcrR family transcriptional regulator [Phycisphaerae bacterium]|nr:TetR/AcrR family transcriptional regulator [Phycisphaerae bacterium]